MIKHSIFYILVLTIFISIVSCSKSNVAINKDKEPTKPSPSSFSLNLIKVNGIYSGYTYYDEDYAPIIQMSFLDKIDTNSLKSGIAIMDNKGTSIEYNYTLQDNDSTILIHPRNNLLPLTKYTVNVSTTLQSKSGGKLQSPFTINLYTKIDSTDKFPQISDSALLDLVQKQTFKYFWDFGHPVSGMARERNTSGDVVTTGGTGFGIMAMIVAVHRGFIARSEAESRIQKIVGFLKQHCTTYHGAFSHWINGATGATVPFGNLDNGGDIVETAYLMEGLLCARQFFNRNNKEDTTLRNDINALWDAVEWTWYQNNQNSLFWLWSDTNGWEQNVKVQGWNEALITYILAASSNKYAISPAVYTEGWSRNGAIKNGKTFYGYQLPLGEDIGGPLFFEHYTFMAVNPNGLSDANADYTLQTKNHTLINQAYCIANPKNYYGYSALCWGLTASDIPNGYAASSPKNDLGVIAPTAAISSMPFTPIASIKTLKFFYYQLGDKLWGEYGFVDAFSLKDLWFAKSYLAIDQGPQIVMIENYRSGLIWNLFSSCKEVKEGMKKIGFNADYLNK